MIKLADIAQSKTNPPQSSLTILNYNKWWLLCDVISNTAQRNLPESLITIRQQTLIHMNTRYRVQTVQPGGGFETEKGQLGDIVIAVGKLDSKLLLAFLGSSCLLFQLSNGGKQIGWVSQL